MKYIKLFENMNQLSVREFNDVVTELKSKLNFIGFDLHVDNPKTNYDSNSDKEYTITFDFNLNGVKNSVLSYFCPLIIKNSDNKELPLDSKINFNSLNTYKIIIKYDLIDVQSYIIKPIDEEEGYVKCMSKLLYLIDRLDNGVKINKLLYVIRDGRISSLLKLVRIFIKDNISNYNNYTPNIIISDEFMTVINTLIEYYMDSNIHSFNNFAKKYHPELYAKLVEIYGNGADPSSEMGEMGF